MGYAGGPCTQGTTHNHPRLKIGDWLYQREGGRREGERRGAVVKVNASARVVFFMPGCRAGVREVGYAEEACSTHQTTHTHPIKRTVPMGQVGGRLRMEVRWQEG